MRSTYQIKATEEESKIRWMWARGRREERAAVKARTRKRKEVQHNAAWAQTREERRGEGVGGRNTQLD